LIKGEIIIAFWDRLKKKSPVPEKEADPCDEKEFAPRCQPMSLSWQTVSVFVSSTFNNMHTERDYFV